jgi:hypothetical protein
MPDRKLDLPGNPIPDARPRSLHLAQQFKRKIRTPRATLSIVILLAFVVAVAPILVYEDPHVLVIQHLLLRTMTPLGRGFQYGSLSVVTSISPVQTMFPSLVQLADRSTS